MSEGSLYCFSNKLMPGIFKVGMTERTPEERLEEANRSNTWIAKPFESEFAKKVLNPKQKETTLHTLLSQYRINPKREFFKISSEIIKKYFDLMDGEWWIETVKEDQIITHKTKLGCRDMSKCFTNGQRIKHTAARTDKTWIGIYDSSKNGIVYDTKFFKSLSTFAETHNSVDRPDRSPAANGWLECKCEIDGKWISTFNL